MFDQLTSIDTINAGYRQLGDSALERHMAQRTYERVLGKGLRKRAQSALFGRSRRLMALADVQNAQRVTDQVYMGVQTVMIDHIRGTESRSSEFDAEFYPLADHIEQRWISVASAHLKGVQLPPVELIRVGDTYFVRDGHHRVSVARAYGQATIDAVVIEWKTEPQN